MTRGVIAAGHAATAHAAEEVLRAGGNAFDAIVAAGFMSCVAEPVLSSLGGGGFLLASEAGASPRLFDFFVHTPRTAPPAEDLDFFPIHADFGSTTQEFHIGLGSVATPGMVRGLFEINRRLGRMPMREIIAPAIAACRDGLRINAFQQYLFEVVAPIYRCSENARRVFGRAPEHEELVRDGDLLAMPEFGATLEALGREGDALFYDGEIARSIDRLCAAAGGTLRADDLANYRVVERRPVVYGYRDTQVACNPPPSCGGVLIAFALALLEGLPAATGTSGSIESLNTLAEVMAATNAARAERFASAVDCADGPARLLDPALLSAYRERVVGNPAARRGTTHISIIDADGNAASMSLSNGEGCGHMIPGTGIMLNNMLGEEDLNPSGFHCWQTDRRMTSMMSPTLLSLPDRTLVALGSGGSNRIRTAVLQVICNLVDHGMSLHAAVNAPRIHHERGLLNIEHGFAAAVVEALVERYPLTHVWDDHNLFFGGVHAVSYHPAKGFDGAGDQRRSGVACTV